VLILRFLLRIYNLYFSKDKNLAQRVRQMTGFVPARLSIFKLAFSHKSNQGTRDFAQTNNERLEYLGDAVLGTIVAEYLFKKYPNGDEGFLTKMRSKIVKRKSLNYIGDQMGLDVLLTEYNRTRLSSSMLGNAVEALVGAVYLEKGYRGTERFVIQRMLKLYVDMHELETVDDNYKSQLLEYCQKNGMQVTYKLLNKFKQDRRDRFKVAVMVNGEQLSLADDFNKKSAEQLASLRALQKLGLIDKATPQEDGRKSPAKKTKKESDKPTKARSERKPKPAAKSPTAKKASVKSNERSAAVPVSKIQAEKPKRAPRKQPKSAVAKTPRPTSNQSKTSPSGATLPARKQRRNNSRLGRVIWNGIQAGGTSIELVDELWYFEKESRVTPATKPKDEKKQASGKTQGSKRSSGASAKTKTVENTLQATGVDVPSKSLISSASKKVKPSSAPKTRNSRVRRPIPLRLLTPIVKDASAVMAIDFNELFGLPKASTSASRSRPKKTDRKPEQKSPVKKRVASKKQDKGVQQSIREESWEDTPLGLSSAKAALKKPASVRKLRPNGEKKPGATPKSKVASEKIAAWEDTLLEIDSDGEAVTTKFPKMYKTSNGKESTGRRRPQRRRPAPTKKKTED
jgi:ribonuclease-3